MRDKRTSKDVCGEANNTSACNVITPLIKKPEKDFGFNDVGRGNLENCAYLFLQKSLLRCCILLLKGVNVYHHTCGKS